MKKCIVCKKNMYTTNHTSIGDMCTTCYHLFISYDPKKIIIPIPDDLNFESKVTKMDKLRRHIEIPKDLRRKVHLDKMYDVQIVLKDEVKK